MPIHFVEDEDKLVWNYSKDKDYTIKFAYYHAMELLISHLRVEGD